MHVLSYGRIASVCTPKKLIYQMLINAISTGILIHTLHAGNGHPRCLLL